MVLILAPRYTSFSYPLDLLSWYKSKFKEQTASTGSFQGFILGLIQLAFGKDIGEVYPESQG